MERQVIGVSLALLYLTELSYSERAAQTNESREVIPTDPDLPDPLIQDNQIQFWNSAEDEDIPKRNFGLSHNADDVKFMLYYSPRHPNRYDRLDLSKRLTMTHARFKRGSPVIFVVHGFLSGAEFENTSVPIIKNALLGQSIVNVITVDWSKLSTSESPIAFLSYAEVTQNVPIVGRRVADMIMNLIDLGIIPGPEALHLIGHSLGAHVMGVAGFEVHNRTGMLVNHITGLDPAGPLYQFIDIDNKLDPTDAAYIDVLHTDVGMFGSSEILGTADFYANGGKGYAQPGCLNFTLNNPGGFARGVSGICSHSRAYRLYARSIARVSPELYGCRCRILIPSAFLPTSCTQQEMTICQARVLYGYHGPHTATGTYYVETQDAHDVPFFGSMPLTVPPW